MYKKDTLLLLVVILIVFLVFMCWPKKKSYMEEKKVFSQNGEDGITLYLKDKLFNDDSKNYFYVEFGVEDGSECNTRILRDSPNWSGLLMDGSNENESINLKKEFITKENIVSLFEKYSVPKHINILSVDIDYNDFYVLHEILKNYTCDVIICEYNGSHKSNEDKVVVYSSETMWDGSKYYGASLLAMKILLNKFGYDLFKCNETGVNSFFVNEKYGLNGGDIEEVYKPNKQYYKEDELNRNFITSSEAMNFVKDRPRIVISLTTIPRRLDLLAETTKNLNEQTMKPDEIALNVPHVFKRTDEEYDMSKIHSFFTVYRCEDYGPATKFFPTLMREGKNTLLIVLDDDIEYKKDMVEKIYNKYLQNKNSLQCGGVTPIAQACDVYAFSTDVIQDDFEEYFLESQKNEQCFRGDDFVIDYYMRSKGVKRLFHNEQSEYQEKVNVPPDSLSKMNDAKTKYITCETELLNTKWKTPTNYQHLNEI